MKQTYKASSACRICLRRKTSENIIVEFFWGSMETPKKTTFRPEFCNEIYTIIVCTIRNHSCEKKIMYRFKMVAKLLFFLFRVISILAKNLKIHFPKGILQ